MKTLLRHLILTSLCLIMPQMALASENESTIGKLTEPIIDLVPEIPSDAQSSHDRFSIEQLMKLVELSRTIGGSLIEIVNAVVDQTIALESIRDAQRGSRTIPFFNGDDDVAGREGGAGLKEMADGALDGALEAPEGVKNALDRFRPDFHLDKAFAQKDSEAISRVLAAYATAQGAVGASTGEESYKRANASMSRLNSYISALETSVDLKTSLDLNTRVAIEMTQQLNESLRTQAAIASMAGSYFMVLGGESGQEGILDALKNFNR